MARTCSVAGCDLLVLARGLCQAHYDRVRRHGSVQAERPVGQRPRPREGPNDTIWCGRCKRFLAKSAFATTTKRGVPQRSRCLACTRAERKAQIGRKARLDPAWYEAKLAKQRTYRRTYTSRAERASKERRKERSELIVAIDAWLRGQGLRVADIADALGVNAGNYYAVLRSARRGAATYRRVAQRVLQVPLVAGGLPAVGKREGGQPHAWVPVLRARLARLEAT